MLTTVTRKDSTITMWFFLSWKPSFKLNLRHTVQGFKENLFLFCLLILDPTTGPHHYKEARTDNLTKDWLNNVPASEHVTVNMTQLLRTSSFHKDNMSRVLQNKITIHPAFILIRSSLCIPECWIETTVFSISVARWPVESCWSRGAQTCPSPNQISHEAAKWTSAENPLSCMGKYQRNRNFLLHGLLQSFGQHDQRRPFVPPYFFICLGRLFRSGIKDNSFYQKSSQGFGQVDHPLIHEKLT